MKIQAQATKVNIGHLFLRLLRKLGVLPFVNFYVSVRRQETTYKIPILRGVGMGHLQTSEPWMLSLLRSITMNSDSTFVDIGVNIGQTLLTLKSANPGLPYVGFEPNTICVNYVQDLIAANEIEDAQIIPAGICQQSSIAELHCSNDNPVDSGATIIPYFLAQTTVCQTVCLLGPIEVEEILKPRPIGVIKIDVEGAELEVLRALEKTVIKARPIIILEILPNYNGENKSRLLRQREIEKLVMALDYKIFELQKTRKGELKALRSTSSFGSHSDIERCDYVLTPKESKPIVL